MFSVMPVTCTLFWVVRPYLTLRAVLTRAPTSAQSSQARRIASMSCSVRSLRFIISIHCSRLVMTSGCFCTVKLRVPSSSTLSEM